MFKCKAEVSSHKERRGQQGEAMSQSEGVAVRSPGMESSTLDGERLTKILG